MKILSLRYFVLGAVVVGCGGASEFESGRDGTRDSLESGDPSDDAPDSRDGPRPSHEDAGASDTPDEVVAATAVLSPPTVTAPTATAPVAATPPATNADADPPITAVPVPPETWLTTPETQEEPSTGDAGLAEELRVDDLTILVIFDNSGSMDTYWEGGTRWQAANRALVHAIEPVKTSLKAGAIRFPLVTSCGVPDFDSGSQIGFGLGEDFLATWIESGLEPEGGTPLAQAFLVADAAIANASELGLLEDRFRVVVVTDGEPNCYGDPALLTELPAKWYERGVETLVLGLPGSSQATALLDAIAEAGGTHAHQSLGTTEELNTSVTAAAR